ncbi:MAG: thiamine phosphate synthase [Pseudomonadota bacterium]
MKKLPNPLLYFILSLEDIGDLKPIALAKQVLAGGAKVLQLRSKKLNQADLFSLGQEIKTICQKHNALFIVNDYPELALKLQADGLHIGQEDLPPTQARKIVGSTMLLGLSCHNLKQIKQVDPKYVDYIGVGPIYPSSTKIQNNPPLGPNFLKHIQNINTPFVAIGGITTMNSKNIVAAGCRRIAAISGLSGAKDIGQEASLYTRILKGERSWLHS